jgi:hypothetical protein
VQAKMKNSVVIPETSYNRFGEQPLIGKYTYTYTYKYTAFLVSPSYLNLGCACRERRSAGHIVGGGVSLRRLFSLAVPRCVPMLR